jgi:hypothetical protein
MPTSPHHDQPELTRPAPSDASYPYDQFSPLPERPPARHIWLLRLSLVASAIACFWAALWIAWQLFRGLLVLAKTQSSCLLVDNYSLFADTHGELWQANGGDLISQQNVCKLTVINHVDQLYPLILVAIIAGTVLLLNNNRANIAWYMRLSTKTRFYNMVKADEEFVNYVFGGGLAMTAIVIIAQVAIAIKFLWAY